MRPIAAFLLTVSLASAGLLPSKLAQAAAVDPSSVAGSWKLVLMPFGEDEFAIFDVKPADGKLAATVVSANDKVFGPIKSAEATLDGDKMAIVLAGTGVPTSFRGVLEPDGKKAKGLVKFQGTTYPGRIERTEAKKVADMTPSPFGQKVFQAQAIKDPKEKIAKLTALIGENPGHPMNASAYVALLASAEPGGLSPEDVSRIVTKWVGEAQPFGTEWLDDVQGRALKALQGKKAYASLSTEMAQAAEKALPADASTEARANLATMLANSARLAGKPEIASEAEGRAKVLDGKLDAEYHEKVPPYKTEAFAGRPSGKGDRVMVMEIFTGAECPPCVASDVGFDGLLKTYKPTEFIGLQYHLHVPGPDPLTSAETITRAGYYGSEVRGTPATFFNGKSLAGGGGPMMASEGKYQEFRKIIDPALGSEKQAEIKLTATRVGDEIKVTASATTPGASRDAKPKLRLVLVEESVRYPGGNKLRFHHNVVRAFPGGVQGKDLERGEGSVDATVNLVELRKTQDAYLAAYPTSTRGRAFAHPLPPMVLEDLAVVALVQDDADHAVWHAVQVPVKSGTP